MLNKIISQYLKSNKRLVIPGLGTFVVKEQSGEVIFTEMYRRDDGVLSSLMVENGTPELEAAGEIDRMVFEIRHAVQNGSSYLIEGLGVLRAGENSTIAFAYEPHTVSVEHTVSEAEAQTEVVAPQSEKPTAAVADTETEHRDTCESVSEEVSDSAAKSSAAEMTEERDAAGNCYQKHLDTGRLVNTVETAFANEKRLHEDDDEETSLEDLQYRRPRKSTDAYTYIGRPSRKKGNDRFIWIAIAAALIALTAIAFGYWREMSDMELSAEEYVDEEMAQYGPMQ